jgi:uncharacterized protein (DUF2267 family)
MSATGLDIFDRTLQAINIWLDEIMEKLGPDRQVAWRALGAVLRTLRDELTLGLAAHLGAQLPLLVRGLYYDQWHATGQPLKLRKLDDFLAHVADGLGDIRPVNAQDAVKAVFRVLDHHVEPNQVAKVHDALPAAVRGLWAEQRGDRHGVESAA